MMTRELLASLFWFALLALAFTNVGYPLFMAALCRLRAGGRPQGGFSETPLLSVVLVAFNEEGRIAARLQNLLASDWPPDRLEILVVSDGSTDGTVARAKEPGDARVRVVERRERAGKSACVNAGVAEARGEIVVLCDARQRFEGGTIRQLASNFGDPDVGAVSGELLIDASASPVGGGVDAYWKLERLLRAAEARWHSCIGCTGAVYAIRRALYQPIPADTLLDDVVIPMHITAAGKRVLYDTSARAFDPQPLEPARERVRKQRTLAGNFQMLFRHPGWLLPWRNGRWWQLIAHKYLRLAAPLFMGVLLVTGFLLRDAGFVYSLCWWGQCAFYGLAALGLILGQVGEWESGRKGEGEKGRRGERNHDSPFPPLSPAPLLPHSPPLPLSPAPWWVRTGLLSLPAGFVFLHFMVVGGFWKYLRGAYRRGAWQATT